MFLAGRCRPALIVGEQGLSPTTVVNAILTVNHIMKDSSKNANRIPYESLEQDHAVSAWSLPSIDQKKSRVFLTAKKEIERKSGTNNAAEEIVEDYSGRVKPKPLTAEGLQQLAEEAKKEARELGYKEGFEQGHTAGKTKGYKDGQDSAYKETKNQLNQEIASLSSIAENLLQPMQDQEAQLENVIVDMAMHFAQEILGQEIRHNPESLYRVIENALLALPAGAKNISVFLNESDAEIVDKYLPSNTRNWRVKVDKSLKSGGCKVETLESLVDYTTAARFERFIAHVQDRGELNDNDVAVVDSFRAEELPGVATSPEADVVPEPEESMDEIHPQATALLDEETTVPSGEVADDRHASGDHSEAPLHDK